MSSDVFSRSLSDVSTNINYVLGYVTAVSEIVGSDKIFNLCSSICYVDDVEGFATQRLSINEFIKGVCTDTGWSGFDTVVTPAMKSAVGTRRTIPEISLIRVLVDGMTLSLAKEGLVDSYVFCCTASEVVAEQYLNKMVRNSTDSTLKSNNADNEHIIKALSIVRDAIYVEDEAIDVKDLEDCIQRVLNVVGSIEEIVESDKRNGFFAGLPLSPLNDFVSYLPHINCPSKVINSLSESSRVFVSYLSSSEGNSGIDILSEDFEWCLKSALVQMFCGILERAYSYRSGATIGAVSVIESEVGIPIQVRLPKGVAGVEADVSGDVKEILSKLLDYNTDFNKGTATKLVNSLKYLLL